MSVIGVPGETYTNWVCRDGVRLAYEERGAGDPPLVFVHGWCCDRSYFAPQSEHFARSHRVVALDQRGFGESDKPAQDYTIEGFADDLAWLCAELGVERPVLVGHSMGGAIALATAARHPKLPAGIALCDPAIFFGAGATALQRSLLESMASEGHEPAVREFIENLLFIESDDAQRKARITDHMLETPRSIMHSAFASIVVFDSEKAARNCHVPVLSIDAATPIVESDRFRGCCPQLVVEQTPGAGHFHQLEAPDEVNALLEDFVAAVSRRSV